MNREKVFVILNPAAKGDRARLLREKIEALSPHIALQLTSKQGDARTLAENAVKQGARAVVAAGGDGTINEVVNGIVGKNVALGILPVGTMNVFALELGIPNDLTRAWEIIEKGNLRKIDLGKANNGYFVQLAGVGLDAQVVLETSPDSKKMLGPLSYILSLAHIVAQKPPVLRGETSEGKQFEGRFIMVGNGRFYGGPFTMFKEASLDDRLLDVVVFKNQSHWDLIRYMQALFFKTHDELPDVEYFQAQSVRIWSEQQVPYEMDGEMAGHLPVHFSFAEQALEVFAPAENTEKPAG